MTQNLSTINMDKSHIMDKIVDLHKVGMDYKIIGKELSQKATTDVPIFRKVTMTVTPHWRSTYVED